MPKKIFRRPGLRLLIGLLILVMGLLFLPARSRDNPLSRGVLSLVAKSHEFINRVIQGGYSVWANYLYLINLRQENQHLRGELVHLERDRTQLLELSMENARLRQLLGFKEETPFTTLPAQVVGREPTSWFKTVLINKGSGAGVARQATVVTHAGLVGHVVQLSEKAAKVLLITDHASRVAVLIQRTRTEGILAGEGRETGHIQYLSRLADVQVGDVVISSGLGGVFPKGLIAGEVVAIDKQNYGLFQSVEVAPSADLSRLEEVLVLQKH